MAYKVIPDRFWIEYKNLKKDEKYLLVHLRSCPSSHYSGVFYLPVENIACLSGLEISDINRLLDTLSIPYRYPIDRVSEAENNKIQEIQQNPSEFIEIGYLLLYDRQNSIVFLKDMLFDQTDGNLSDKQVKGIAKYIDSLPPSPVINEFLECYDYLNIKKFLSKKYPIQHFLKFRNINTNTSMNTNKNSNQESSGIVDNFSGNGNKDKASPVFFKISQEESKNLFSLVDAIGLQEDFNPKQFIFRCLKNNVPTDITITALDSLHRGIQRKALIKNKWGYVTEIVKRQCVQRGIQATIEEHEKNKEEEKEFARHFFSSENVFEGAGDVD